MGHKTKAFLFSGFMGAFGVIAVALALLVIAGCQIAGQVPVNLDDVPEGATVTAERQDLFGSSETTIKGGKPKDPAAARQETENTLNNCLGQYGKDEVRLCGCLSRAGLTDEWEFTAYCVKAQPKPDPEPPPVSSPIVWPRDTPTASLGEPIEVEGEGKAWARVTAENAVGDLWGSLNERCRLAMTEIVELSEPGAIDEVAGQFPRGVRRRTSWTAWLLALPAETWIDSDAARVAIASAREVC